jgi:hypothetical protein
MPLAAEVAAWAIAAGFTCQTAVGLTRAVQNDVQIQLQESRLGGPGGSSSSLVELPNPNLAAWGTGDGVEEGAVEG